MLLCPEKPLNLPLYLLLDDVLSLNELATLRCAFRAIYEIGEMRKGFSDPKLGSHCSGWHESWQYHLRLSPGKSVRIWVLPDKDLAQRFRMHT